MKKFVIELDADKVDALSSMANLLGISPEDYIKGIVDTALDPEAESSQKIPDEQYQEIKGRILTKYAELYRRLA
ncbi:MAG: hypothetical protein AAFP02_01060 [Bacteroidota bacterium]